MAYEDSIIRERRTLAEKIAKETNPKEREKLMDLDLKLRDQLASHYAKTDRQNQNIAQQAHQRMKEIELKASMGNRAYEAMRGR